LTIKPIVKRLEVKKSKILRGVTKRRHNNR
jgi:hypothetical protein